MLGFVQGTAALEVGLLVLGSAWMAVVALATALGPRAATVPVSATKALTGHPLGATGAIEAAMATLAVAEGWVPGTVNLEAPEPELAALLPNLLPEGCDSHPSARYPLVVNHGHFPYTFDGFRPEPPDTTEPCQYSARFSLDCYNRIQDSLNHQFYRDWTGPAGLDAARALVCSFIEYWDAHRAILRTRNLAAQEGDRRFREVRIAPRMFDLDYAIVCYPTPAGIIEVRSERVGKQGIGFQVELPKGVSGVLDVPGLPRRRLAAGAHRFASE